MAFGSRSNFNSKLCPLFSKSEDMHVRWLKVFDKSFIIKNIICMTTEFIKMTNEELIENTHNKFKTKNIQVTSTKSKSTDEILRKN